MSSTVTRLRKVDAVFTSTLGMHFLGHHIVCVLQATTQSLKMHREMTFICASVVAIRCSAQQKIALTWLAWIVLLELMQASYLVSAAGRHTVTAIQEATVWCVLSPTVTNACRAAPHVSSLCVPSTCLSWLMGNNAGMAKAQTLMTL